MYFSFPVNRLKMFCKIKIKKTLLHQIFKTYLKKKLKLLGEKNNTIIQTS